MANVETRREPTVLHPLDDAGCPTHPKAQFMVLSDACNVNMKLDVLILDPPAAVRSNAGYSVLNQWNRSAASLRSRSVLVRVACEESIEAGRRW